MRRASHPFSVRREKAADPSDLLSSYDGNRRANMLCGVPVGAGRVRFVGTAGNQNKP